MNKKTLESWFFTRKLPSSEERVCVSILLCQVDSQTFTVEFDPTPDTRVQTRVVRASVKTRAEALSWVNKLEEELSTVKSGVVYDFYWHRTTKFVGKPVTQLATYPKRLTSGLDKKNIDRITNKAYTVRERMAAGHYSHASAKRVGGQELANKSASMTVAERTRWEAKFHKAKMKYFLHESENDFETIEVSRTVYDYFVRLVIISQESLFPETIKAQQNQQEKHTLCLKSIFDASQFGSNNSANLTKLLA